MYRDERATVRSAQVASRDEPLNREVEAVAYLADYARRHGLTALDESLTAVLAKLYSVPEPMLVE